LQLIRNFGAQLEKFYKAPVYDKKDKRKPHNPIQDQPTFISHKAQ